MTYIRNFVSVIGILLICGQPCMAATQACNQCTEIIPPTIPSQQIIDQILQGNYQNAINLVGDALLQALRKTLNDPKKIAAISAKVLEKVVAILNDATKTEQQKAESITAVIEESMEPYSSAKAGALGVAFSHSISFGTTRLTWDKKIEIDECHGVYAGYECVAWNSAMQCTSSTWVSRAWTDYVRKVPDYYIYRIVNGQEKLITKLLGRSDIQRNSIGFSGDVFTTFVDAYNFYKNKPNIDTSRAVFYDTLSDLRPLGTTLQYRIVADNSPYKYGNCGSSERYDSVAFVDQNGNGHADFIPESVYQAYWAQRNGWLVPVITNYILQ